MTIRKILNIDSSLFLGQQGLANRFKTNNWRIILYENPATVHILAFIGLGESKQTD